MLKIKINNVTKLGLNCCKKLFRKPKNGRKNRQKKESSEETKEPAGKSIMIRLYPNESQKEKLNKWFGTARWTYV
jgi:hypothetical protein